jgi:hypothetical protein
LFLPVRILILDLFENPVGSRTSLFNEILDYITKNSGPITANIVYEKVIKEIELLRSERVITRKSQELVNIGINDIYELVSVHKVGYFADRPCIFSPKGCENAFIQEVCP